MISRACDSSSVQGREASQVLPVILITRIFIFTHSWNCRHEFYLLIDVTCCQLYLGVDLKNEISKVQNQFCRYLKCFQEFCWWKAWQSFLQSFFVPSTKSFSAEKLWDALEWSVRFRASKKTPIWTETQKEWKISKSQGKLGMQSSQSNWLIIIKCRDKFFNLQNCLFYHISWEF